MAYYLEIYVQALSWIQKETEKPDTILIVEKDHEIMSDRDFSIQEFWATKGITLNHPKQKY